MALRQTFEQSVRLDGNGAGSVSITARGDVDVQHTSVIVYPVPPVTSSVLIPQAALTLNGKPFEGSQTGNFDASDTRHLMLAQETLTCTWTGGDPNATAVLTVRGIEYPAGQGIAAVAKQ